MTEEEISQETGLFEFKLGTGPTMPAGDNLSRKGKMNSSSGIGGKGSKSFGNFMNRSANEAPEEVHAINIDYMNFDPEDEYKALDDLSLAEAIRGAREIATKELGQISTKQPWANGIPTSEDEYSITAEEEPELDLEKETGLSLESIMEYADTDWGRAAQSKKAQWEKADLGFLDDVMSSGNEYTMNSEEEFEENERMRKK